MGKYCRKFTIDMTKIKGKETKEFEGIGEVIFVKSKRAKYARITLKAGGVVQVTVPGLMPYVHAHKFVEEKRNWIVSHRIKLQKKVGEQTVFDENTEFRTNLHKLEIYRVDSAELKFKVSTNRIQVLVPKFFDIVKKEVQEFIQAAIIEAWRKEAKLILPIRTKELALLHGLEFISVTIRNTTSRWGSCSFHNKINLSLHLMKLPEELRDYVILHELAHTVHKHHQPSFWQFLDTLTQGKAKQLDKQLKNFSTQAF